MEANKIWWRNYFKANYETLMQHLILKIVIKNKIVFMHLGSLFKIQFFCILFILSSINIFGQKAQVENLRYTATSVIDADIEINYPLIRTVNNTVDRILNNNLKNDLLSPGDPSVSMQTALIEKASIAHSLYIDFEITYNKNDIISIQFIEELCIANCDSATYSFVYSLRTGNSIVLSELLDTTALYQNMVKDDVELKYKEHIEYIRKSDPETFWNTVDKEYLNEYIIPSYETCKEEFNMNEFCLLENEIRIDAPCFFSRSERELRPDISLNYTFDSIKQYLKVKL